MDFSEDDRAALEAQGQERKMTDEDKKEVIKKAHVAKDNLNQQLTVEAVMERTDDIVHAFKERIERQKEIIDRLLGADESDKADVLQGELDIALNEIENRDSRIHNLERRLDKAEKKLKRRAL